jgi:tetratricopeptide (TPR) repeat protein
VATERQARRARAPGVDVSADAIRQARLDAGLSRAKLAGDDLTRGAIYLIETGRSRPSMATLELIAARTGKPLSHFLEPGEDAAASAHLAVGVAAEVSELERDCLAGRHEQARARGASLLDEQLEPRWEARAALWLGVAELHLGLHDESRQHLDRSLELLSRLSDPWTRAACLAWRAQAALAAGEADAASLAQQADRESRDADPIAWPASVRALLVLGRTRMQAEDWKGARESFHAALDAARAGADAGRAAGWYEDMGTAYLRLGDAPTAVECSWRAVALYALRESRELAVEASAGLADSQLRDGDPEAARQQLEAALAETEGLALRRGEVHLLLGLAAVGLRQSRLEEAGRYARRAAVAAESAHDTTATGLSHALLARVAAAAGDSATAGREFQAAIEHLAAAHAADELVETRMAYAEALEAWGETAEALAQWKQSMSHWRPGLGRSFP